MWCFNFSPNLGEIYNYLRISSIELLISFKLAKQCLAFQNTRNRITVSMVVRTCENTQIFLAEILENTQIFYNIVVVLPTFYCTSLKKVVT